MALMGMRGNDKLTDASLENGFNLLNGGEGNDLIVGNNIDTIASYANFVGEFNISKSAGTITIEQINKSKSYNEGKDTVIAVPQYLFADRLFNSIHISQTTQSNSIVLAMNTGLANLDTNGFSNVTLMGNRDANNLVDFTGKDNVLVGRGGNDSLHGNKIDTTAGYAFDVSNFRISALGIGITLKYIGDDSVNDEGIDTLYSINRLNFAGNQFNSISKFSSASQNNQVIYSDVVTNATFSTGDFSNVAIMGTKGDDTLNATSGKSALLVGSGGNDNLNGNDSDTTAGYAHDIVTYLFKQFNSGYLVENISSRQKYSDGYDTLSSISKYQFGGETYNSLINSDTYSSATDNYQILVSTSANVLSTNSKSNTVLFGNNGNDTLNDTSGINNLLVGSEGNDTINGNSIDTTAGYINNAAAYSITVFGNQKLISNLMLNSYINEGEDSLTNVNRLNFAGFRYDSVITGTMVSQNNQLLVDQPGVNSFYNINGFDNITIHGQDGDDVFFDQGGGINHIFIGGQGNDSYSTHGSSVLLYAHNIANYVITQVVGNYYLIQYVGEKGTLDEGIDRLNSNNPNNPTPKIYFEGFHFDGITSFTSVQDNFLIVANNINTPQNVNINNSNVGFLGSNANDTINDSNGHDNVLVGGRGNDTLSGAIDRSTIVAYAYNIYDYQYSFESNLTITDASRNLSYNEGADSIFNIFNFNFNGSQYVYNPASISHNQIINAQSSYANNFNYDNVVLVGNNQGTNLTGGNNRDILIGGGGVDNLNGGNGDDIFVGAGNNDFINGGFGLDMAVYRGAVSEYNFSGMFSNIIVIDTIINRDDTDTLNEIEILRFNMTPYNLKSGTANPDNLITSNSTNNLGYIMLGFEGADTIIGSKYNDVLVGGADNDILRGGKGDDYYLFRIAAGVSLGSDTITEKMAEGNDTIDFTGSVSGVTIDLSKSSLQVINSNLSLIIDELNSIENVVGGIGNDILVGNSFNNVIQGGEGNDILTGGLGSDTFVYTSISDSGSSGDIITDFTSGINGDVLSLRTLLNTFIGYDGTNTQMYLKFTQSGANTLVEVDIDGMNPSNNFLTLVTLNNIVSSSILSNNYISPVVLDMNGSGINLLSSDESTVSWNTNNLIKWDLYDVGENPKSGWIGEGNGILVFDHDNDGIVKDINEFALTMHVPQAKSDLEALKIGFDSNDDNIFDINDQQYDHFGVWQDINVNGVVDSNEYATLSQLGIVSISLFSDSKYEIMNGNIIHGYSSYQTENGNSHTVADVSFLIGPQTPAVNDGLYANKISVGDVFVESSLVDFSRLGSSQLSPSTSEPTIPSHTSSNSLPPVDITSTPEGEQITTMLMTNMVETQIF